MEHLVIILNRSIQKVTAALIQRAGVFAVFLIQNLVSFAMETEETAKIELKPLRRCFCLISYTLLFLLESTCARL
ncbi:hypothetical protein [Agathobaculum sp. Marseille-P7918]|uniref:hypothetical protein n=1 Tax=Agathobaculum sp. Marseille-P7918 TaxID=2479843 RepID=UPI003FA45437